MCEHVSARQTEAVRWQVAETVIANAAQLCVTEAVPARRTASSVALTTKASLRQPAMIMRTVA